jgi:hypothetical protein
MFGSPKTGVIDADSKTGLFFGHAFGDQCGDLLNDGESDCRGRPRPREQGKVPSFSVSDPSSI